MSNVITARVHAVYNFPSCDGVSASWHVHTCTKLNVYELRTGYKPIGDQGLRVLVANDIGPWYYGRVGENCCFFPWTCEVTHTRMAWHGICLRSAGRLRALEYSAAPRDGRRGRESQVVTGISYVSYSTLSTPGGSASSNSTNEAVDVSGDARVIGKRLSAYLPCVHGMACRMTGACSILYARCRCSGPTREATHASSRAGGA